MPVGEKTANGLSSRFPFPDRVTDSPGDQSAELVQPRRAVAGGSVGVAADAVTVPVKAMRVVGADPDGA